MKRAANGTPEPIIEDIIVKTSAELGFQRRPFSNEEILERYVYALINTGAKVLEEGLALRASDIDVIWHYVTGSRDIEAGPCFVRTLSVLIKLDKVSQFHEDYGLETLRSTEVPCRQVKALQIMWFPPEGLLSRQCP